MSSYRMLLATTTAANRRAARVVGASRRAMSAAASSSSSPVSSSTMRSLPLPASHHHPVETRNSGSILSNRCFHSSSFSSSFATTTSLPSFLAAATAAFMAAATTTSFAMMTTTPPSASTSNITSSRHERSTDSSSSNSRSGLLFYSTMSTATNTSCESSSNDSNRNNPKMDDHPIILASSSLVTATPISSSSSSTNTSIGLADETDDNDTAPNSILLHDGMDASTGSGDAHDGGSGGGEGNETVRGPTDDADDDNNDIADTYNSDDDDDEANDDPSMDEETTCSICLINRRGPCRKYWLKFEKCMKEHHNAEKKEDEREGMVQGGTRENVKNDSDGIGSNNMNCDDGGNKGAVPSLSLLEDGWDEFMTKSTRPGEEDDDEDEVDKDDDDDDDDDEEGEDDDGTTTKDSTTIDTKASATTTTKTTPTSSLAERCDKHMIPWIECIQRHRNTYSLISNDFYQGDYIDPLEYSIPEERRALFGAFKGIEHEEEKKSLEAVDIRNDDSDDGVKSGNGGYVVKFNGVEIDLESWKEHIDAETDSDEEDDNYDIGKNVIARTASTVNINDDDGPHLVNASAKFQLTDPNAKISPNEKCYDSGRGQIEVAYIKDQQGRLLGFDSFNSTKKEKNVDSSDGNNPGEESASTNTTIIGECTFHIVPGETTSIVAYAIYRDTTTTTTTATAKYGERDGASTIGGSTIMREDILYHTPEIPLPGTFRRKK